MAARGWSTLIVSGLSRRSAACRRAWEPARPLGRARDGAHGDHARQTAATVVVVSLRLPLTARLSLRRPASSAGASGWSARSATCSGLEPPTACRTRGPGSTTTAGPYASRLGRRHPTRCRTVPYLRFSRRKAKACTGYRSAPCMPASSSPDISASPPMAKPWSGSEERLGYVHKGIEALMAGARPRPARRQLAGRTSGDSTVAYAYAFSRAVGSGARRRSPCAGRAGCGADGRAGAAGQPSRRYRRDLQRRGLRADARPLRRAARTGAALAADAAFGHRLMTRQHRARRRCRRSRPGGRKRSGLRSGDGIRQSFRHLVELYDNTASLQDRTVGTGSAQAHARPAIWLPAAMSAAPRPRSSTRAAMLAPIRPMTSSSSTYPFLQRGRRQCARLDPHPRGRAEPVPDRARSWTGCRKVRRARAKFPKRRRGEGMAIVEGFRGDVLSGFGSTQRPDRTLPSARSVLVSVAAAGGRDREQHRRRLSRSATSRSTAPIRPRSFKEGRDAQAPV